MDKGVDEDTPPAHTALCFYSLPSCITPIQLAEKLVFPPKRAPPEGHAQRISQLDPRFARKESESVLGERLLHVFVFPSFDGSS